MVWKKGDFTYFYLMSTSASYQELYESSLREIALLQEKLAVALAEINQLRRQLFGLG
ncbi:MAG: hypothetical protein V4714_21895 [Bacteroidota bacterium]